MKKFEYMQIAPKMDKGIMAKSFDLVKLSVEFNKLGEDGWELVQTINISGNTGVSWGAATTGVVFIFKREIV